MSREETEKSDKTYVHRSYSEGELSQVDGADGRSLSGQSGCLLM